MKNTLKGKSIYFIFALVLMLNSVNGKDHSGKEKPLVYKWKIQTISSPGDSGPWSNIIYFGNKFIALSSNGISFFNGKFLKNVVKINENVFAADYNGSYLAYSLRPKRANFQLNHELLISSTRERGGNLNIIKTIKFNVPFSQWITGIKFISKNKILITSFLEYGIVSINSTSKKVFTIKFEHYPFNNCNSEDRLSITKTLIGENIIVYSGDGANLLQKKTDRNYVMKELFHINKDLNNNRNDELNIEKLVMSDTSFGVFLVNNSLVYFHKNNKPSANDFIVTNYIHLNNSDSINTGDIIDLKLLNENQLICLTNRGQILEQDIHRKDIIHSTWKTVKIEGLLMPSFIGVFNQDTLVTDDGYKLLMLIKKGSSENEINDSKNIIHVFDVERLAQSSTSYGVGIGDLENNGSTDIYLVDVYGKNKLFTSIPQIKLEDNFPEDVAAERGIAGRISKAGNGIQRFDLDIGVAIGDINEDGAEDVILSNLVSSNSLYLNNGKGYFQDVTKAFHFNKNMWRSEGNIFGDVNNDGYLDVFSTSFLKSNRLFINDHGDFLNDATKKYNLDSRGRTVSAVFGDVNNDGYLDLYTANWMKSNKLYLNDKKGKFIDHTAESKVGGGDLKETNSVFFADLNNDGYLDLFVGNRAGSNKLYLNKGDGTFRDVTKQAGLDGNYHTYGAVFGDFENDGWQDIVLSCLGGLKYFKNLGIDGKGNIHFKDITSECIIPNTLFDSYNTGLATADFGNKGFLDFVMNQNAGYTYFFLNSARLDGSNNYLSVKVEGDESNRDAIGAKLKLFYKDSLIAYREVSGGYGYASSSSKIQHFGLDTLTNFLSLVVYFPATHITKKISVRPNTFLTIKEHSGYIREYYLAKKNLLRFIYGDRFILLGSEFILLLIILICIMTWVAKILRLQTKVINRNLLNKIYFNKAILGPSLVIFYGVKLITVESMSFYLGSIYYIINSTNIFTDEVLPLAASSVFMIFFLFVKKNRESKTLSRYNVLDDLLIVLKRFGHGEGMLIILHRLSLLIENQIISNDENNEYEKEGFERISSAYSEFGKAVHPEILRMYSLLNQLHDKFWDKLNVYSKFADSILERSESITKNCELLLTASSLKEKQKAKNNTINSLNELKQELIKVRQDIRLNFATDIMEAVELAVMKFRELNPTIVIQIKSYGERMQAIISHTDLNEILNIIIQNAIDSLVEGKIIDGKILISINSAKEKANIKIEDNGIGIADKYKENIFTQGFTTKSFGHGLGLSIVKNCLSKYEGEIFVCSAESGGAVFTITLSTF